MKRLVLALSPLALGACVVVPTGPGPEAPPPVYQAPPPVYQAPPPAARAEVWYGGEHFIPDAFGGGWCYEGRPHVHDYYPDRPDAYVMDGGTYYYRGPLVFTYYEGHPVPGGGWCYVRGPHTHEFLPPSGRDWVWRRDRGYVYQGTWRPQRPPPATYWPRVTRPAPAYSGRPAPAPATREYDAGRPAPTREYDAGRPAPTREYYDAGRPAPAREPYQANRPAPGYPPAQPAPAAPGRSEYAPGHGNNLPPGHGGTPPGQVMQAPPVPGSAVQAPAPGRDDRGGPGRSGEAPGHGGGLPPGQQRRSAPAATQAPATSPAPAATPATGPARAAAPAAPAAGPAHPAAPTPAPATPARPARPAPGEKKDDQRKTHDDEHRAPTRDPVRL